MVTFAEMGISEPIARVITELGYEEPTAIQGQAIPLLLAGHVLVDQARRWRARTGAR